MPRPPRCRRICRKPVFCEFGPTGGDEETSTGLTPDEYEAVQLTLDEYEVIRLVDFEKKTHEQCAEHMDLSRTTVTEIYENARFKMSDCIVNGKRLVITGGHYRLCDGSAIACSKRRCRKRTVNNNGGKVMKVAVTYENGEVFQHFGHTEKFKVYDIEDNKVVSSQVVDTNGQGHGALAGFLAAAQVDTLICGGIGGGAQNALADEGIKVYGGVSGNTDEVVDALLNGKLDFNPDVKCNHHDHEHGEGHTCGSHGCGSHSCH